LLFGEPGDPAARKITPACSTAGAGAGAGAGTQILTRGKTVKVPAETTLRFKLDQPLMLSAVY